MPQRGNHPDLLHSGAVARHMQAAIVGILTSAAACAPSSRATAT
jgi:hypothetical protein